MTIYKCHQCDNRLLNKKVKKCPKCGSRIKITTASTQSSSPVDSVPPWLGVTVVVAAIVGAVVLLYTWEGGPSNSTSRRTSNAPTSRAVVKNSGWDGSVSQVKSWLTSNLKDPGSLEFIEWSSVQKTNDGGFMVRVKYRAKNSFGGYVVENKIFYLNATGSVTNTIGY